MRNLKRRHLTYYVRVGVNPKHRGIVGKSEIVRSLKTRDRRVAERMMNGVIQQIKDEIAAMVEGADLQPSEPAWLQNVARDLRAQVAAGEMDSGDAATILDDLREKHMKAAGMSEDGPVPVRIKTAARLVREPDYLPMSEAVDRYLASVEKDITPDSWAKKKQHLDEFMTWAGDITVSRITRKLVSKYVLDVLKDNGRAPRTNTGAVSILSTFYKWLIRTGETDGPNPFADQAHSLRGSKKGQQDTSYRAWLPEELTAIFETLDGTREGTVKHSAGIVARISLYTGMRQDEVCSMKVAEVNLEERLMVIPEAKTKSSVRQVYIPDQLLPLITELVESSDDEYLVSGLKPGGRGGKRSHALGNRFSEAKSSLFPKAGRSLAFHGLRSTYITAAEKAGLPETTTELLVGHARQGMSYGLYSKGDDFEGLSKAAQRVADQIETHLTV